MGGEGAGEGISTKIGAGGHGCNSRDGVEEKEARKEGERVSQMLRSGSGGDPPSKLCGRKTTVGCCGLTTANPTLNMLHLLSSL